MSPVGAIFMPFPPKTGINLLHPLPPPIVERVEGQFSPPEARMAGEPRMQLFAPSAPAEKADFFVLGAKTRRFFGAPKKKRSRLKIFLGGRKSYLAAEHHNEAAPKKKKPRFFRLGAEKYCSLGARRKSRFLVLGAEKKKSRRKKIVGAEIFLGGVEKVIWPPNTITRWRRKIYIYIFPLGRRKIRL